MLYTKVTRISDHIELEEDAGFIHNQTFGCISQKSKAPSYKSENYISQDLFFYENK